MWDIAIVGAGPAGSVSAYLLSKAGFKVLLVDRHDFPRDKPCGGGITYRSHKVLERLGLKDYPVERAHSLVRIEGFGYEVSVEHKPFAINLVRREAFDSYLLDRALDEGATFKRGNVTGVKQGKDSVTLLGVQERASFVVGADGANSIVARSAGLRNGWKKEETIFAIEGSAPPMETLTFIVDAAPLGYGWLFPRSSDTNAGVGGLATKAVQIKRAFETFSKKFGVRGVNAAIIPVGGIDLPVSNERVILAGDSAGLVDPLTGEGIYYAVSEAELVAKAMDSDDPSRSYEELLNPIRRELRMKKRAFKLLIPRIKFFFELLAAYPEIARRYMLTSIGEIPFEEFWGWALKRVPIATLTALVRRAK